MIDYCLAPSAMDTAPKHSLQASTAAAADQLVRRVVLLPSDHYAAPPGSP